MSIYVDNGGIKKAFINHSNKPVWFGYVNDNGARKIIGTELNIAIIVPLFNSVPFMTIINPVPFILAMKALNSIKHLIANSDYLRIKEKLEGKYKPIFALASEI